jgi:hypothetical protein
LAVGGCYMLHCPGWAGTKNQSEDMYCTSA